MVRRALAAALGAFFCLHAARPAVKIEGDPTDYGTITNAVAHADNGDRILVSTGTYAEAVQVLDFEALTIEGRYNADCTAKVAGTTVVQAASAGVADARDHRFLSRERRNAPKAATVKTNLFMQPISLF